MLLPHVANDLPIATKSAILSAKCEQQVEMITSALLTAGYSLHADGAAREATRLASRPALIQTRVRIALRCNYS